MPYSHIKSTERLVSDLLEFDPSTRSSDTQLLIAAMFYHGIHLTPNQIEKFRKMPSFESITRCRRKLQEQGRFLPPEQITRERHEKSDMIKQEVMRWHA